MTDNITLPRATVQQALEALENSSPDQYPEGAGVYYDAKDALRTALEQQQQQAEPVQKPVAWMYTGVKQDGIEHGPHLVWKPEYMDAMSASKGAKATPLYTAPPQRKPFDILVITTAYEQGVGKGHQAHGRSAEIENPYAPGECQQAWALGYDEGKKQAASKAAHGIKEQP